MKSVVLQESPEEKLVVRDSPVPELKADEVLVKIKAAALNHRDQWCREGMYPNLRYPSILGSDGCGVVEKVFNENHSHWVGKEVIMNPNVNWGENPEMQSFNYTILGMPTNGTLAQYLAIPAHRLHLKPPHLNDEQAAALPLAALTAFRCCFHKANVSAGQNVLVTGIGGGVAQFAMLFALAVGAKVFVTSGSDAKLEKALGLGATFGVNYKTEGWEKELQKKSPLGYMSIIDGSGGPAFGTLAKMIGPAGTMAVYGTTAGTPSPLHLPRLFFSQASIKGSTMGNDEEFAAMVDFVNQHKIIPIIDSVRPIEEAISAFDEMDEGKQFGKLVIRISS